jgi:hypothetical protein
MCMRVCVYVCVYVCMYEFVCMYVCIRTVCVDPVFGDTQQNAVLNKFLNHPYLVHSTDSSIANHT